MSTTEEIRPSAASTQTRRPLLVYFYSQSSGACRRVEGFLAQVLQRRGNHHTFEMMRVDETEWPDLHGRFQIEEVPTLVVVEDNRLKGRLASPNGCAAIESFLAPWLR